MTYTPSLEHAFQAAKTLDPDERRTVRSAAKAGDAKRAGRKVKKREDWDDIRVSMMRELLYQKFNDPQLRQRLLNTGTAELIEGNDWGDVFWGVCRGRGENWLGKLLMEVRDVCQQGAELMIHVYTGNLLDVIYDYDGDVKVLKGLQRHRSPDIIPLSDSRMFMDTLQTIVNECEASRARAEEKEVA